MDNFHLVRVGSPGAGLIEQIKNIINGILLARLNKCSFVVLTDYYYNKTKACDIETIFDLQALNAVTAKWGITVFNINNIQLTVKQIRFGANEKAVDITEPLMMACGLVNKKGQECLHIGHKLWLIDIIPDPLPGVPKKIYVKYQVNGITGFDSYAEKRDKDIYFDLTKLETQKICNWIAEFDQAASQELLEAIRFQSQNRGDEVFDQGVENNFHVVQIINDDMTVGFWADRKMVSEIEYWTLLNEKYCQTVRDTCSIDSKIVVISENKDNAVFKQLKLEGYNVSYVDSDEIANLSLISRTTGTYIAAGNAQYPSYANFITENFDKKVVYQIIDFEQVC